MSAPFLTFYTPTYRRPRLLADCVASVAAQDCNDWEHVIIPDEIGIGIDGVFGAVADNCERIDGEYVYFLQDDDVIRAPDMVGRLRAFAEAHKRPPVIICKNIKLGRILPDLWEQRPQLGHIDLGSYIVRADIFKSNAGWFGRRYQGDYDFIAHLWADGVRFAWWDFIVAEAQQRGMGRAE